MSRYQPTVEKIIALYTASGVRLNPRAIEAHAQRLEQAADRFEKQDDQATADDLRDLAYVHRKAALVARHRQPKRRWWWIRPR